MPAKQCIKKRAVVQQLGYEGKLARRPLTIGQNVITQIISTCFGFTLNIVVCARRDDVDKGKMTNDPVVANGNGGWPTAMFGTHESSRCNIDRRPGLTPSEFIREYDVTRPCL